MNEYAEICIFMPAVRHGDAMFIASGIDENAEKPENAEKSTVSGDDR